MSRPTLARPPLLSFLKRPARQHPRRPTLRYSRWTHDPDLVFPQTRHVSCSPYFRLSLSLLSWPDHILPSSITCRTSKPDTTTIPHSVILPLADDKEVFNFQIATESLPEFSLDFSLYPTFGSKLIGRAVVLTSAFEQIKTRQCFVTPLLDHHLKTIGEVSLAPLSCFLPFHPNDLVTETAV
jgi:hypothetical protein